jgi:hypothetical protein
MPRLFRLDTGDDIGVITDAQLKFLVDQLEEEHDNDKDYFIDRDTLELLSDNGADPELLGLIEKAMGVEDEIDIAWDDGPANQ